MLWKPTSTFNQTGFDELDSLLGIGGFPRGKIVELHGPYDSMKTLFVMKLLTGMQEKGLIPAYIDVDRDLNKNYLSYTGIDINRLIMLYLSKNTDIISAISKLTEDNLVDIIVIDSAAAMDVGDDGVLDGIKDTLSKIATTIYGKNCTVLFINQMRQNFKSRKKYVPFCNEAFNTYASIRLGMCVVDRNKGEVSIESIKNKLFRTDHSKIKLML